jgi:hypothetical protein
MWTNCAETGQTADPEQNQTFWLRYHAYDLLQRNLHDMEMVMVEQKLCDGRSIQERQSNTE